MIWITEYNWCMQYTAKCKFIYVALPNGSDPIETGENCAIILTRLFTTVSASGLTRCSWLTPYCMMRLPIWPPSSLPIWPSNWITSYAFARLVPDVLVSDYRSDCQRYTSDKPRTNCLTFFLRHEGLNVMDSLGHPSRTDLGKRCLTLRAGVIIVAWEPLHQSYHTSTSAT